MKNSETAARSQMAKEKKRIERRQSNERRQLLKTIRSIRELEHYLIAYEKKKPIFASD